jgi:hypothetical protein
VAGRHLGGGFGERQEVCGSKSEKTSERPAVQKEKRPAGRRRYEMNYKKEPTGRWRYEMADLVGRLAVRNGQRYEMWRYEME